MALLAQGGTPIEIVEREIPQPGPNQVRIRGKVEFSAVLMM
jgi:hypothetical protein